MKRFNRTMGLGFLIVAGIAGNAIASPNRVVDPSFEMPNLGAWTYVGSAGLDGQNDSLDRPNSGTHCAFINVLGVDSGAVEQEIPTVPGTTYEVTVHLASNFVASGIVSVAFAGDVGFSGNIPASTQGSGPYFPETFDATATSTTSLFDFFSKPTGGTFFIDDVSVTAVPEPASLLVLGSCVSLTMLQRARGGSEGPQ